MPTTKKSMTLNPSAKADAQKSRGGSWYCKALRTCNQGDVLAVGLEFQQPHIRSYVQEPDCTLMGLADRCLAYLSLESMPGRCLARHQRLRIKIPRLRGMFPEWPVSLPDCQKSDCQQRRPDKNNLQGDSSGDWLLCQELQLTALQSCMESHFICAHAFSDTEISLNMHALCR